MNILQAAILGLVQGLGVFFRFPPVGICCSAEF